jgi:hypothetical protein
LPVRRVWRDGRSSESPPHKLIKRIGDDAVAHDLFRKPVTIFRDHAPRPKVYVPGAIRLRRALNPCWIELAIFSRFDGVASAKGRRDVLGAKRNLKSARFPRRQTQRDLVLKFALFHSGPNSFSFIAPES